jgi:hypothetical protein
VQRVWVLVSAACVSAGEARVSAGSTERAPTRRSERRLHGVSADTVGADLYRTNGVDQRGCGKYGKYGSVDLYRTDGGTPKGVVYGKLTLPRRPWRRCAGLLVRVVSDPTIPAAFKFDTLEFVTPEPHRPPLPMIRNSRSLRDACGLLWIVLQLPLRATGGASNDTELEKPKKRVRFVMYCVVRGQSRVPIARRWEGPMGSDRSPSTATGCWSCHVCCYWSRLRLQDWSRLLLVD